MTEQLQGLNFNTISLVDLSKAEMLMAVERFCKLLHNGVYAVFYFSGHGMENYKTTYLVPIDAKSKNSDCVNYDKIKQKMKRKRAKIVLVLDCCRTM